MTRASRRRLQQSEGELRDGRGPVMPPIVTTSPFAPPPVSHPLAPPSGTAGLDRWSLSAWALIRGNGAPPLAAAGQLAGSQLGFRLRRRLAPGLHLALRMSGPVRTGRGKEAALALDLQPIRTLPVTFTIERRQGLDDGGRNAFAAGAFGGFAAKLTPRTSIDGYAQAGAVGLKRRDMYVDGALRMEREVAAGPRVRLGLGAGAWGGAQPGVARLDLGPQLVAHVPVASGGLRIGAEWRQRVAGSARPGSGPVLSLGADF